MDYPITIAISIAIYTILAASYNLVLGYGGLSTVAHPIFFAVGAYTAGLMAVDFPEIPAFVNVIAGLVPTDPQCGDCHHPTRIKSCDFRSTSFQLWHLQCWSPHVRSRAGHIVVS